MGAHLEIPKQTIIEWSRFSNRVKQIYLQIYTSFTLYWKNMYVWHLNLYKQPYFSMAYIIDVHHPKRFRLSPYFMEK